MFSCFCPFLLTASFDGRTPELPGMAAFGPFSTLTCLGFLSCPGLETWTQQGLCFRRTW